MTTTAAAPIVLRPAIPDDAPGILAIAFAHDLPATWAWKPGAHSIVAAREEHVLAFAALNETIWGLVTEELWEEPSRDGMRALALIGMEIEAIAQRLADERGVPLMGGGIVRLDRDRHINALRRRGYEEEAVILTKLFTPKGEGHL